MTGQTSFEAVLTIAKFKIMDYIFSYRISFHHTIYCKEIMSNSKLHIQRGKAASSTVAHGSQIIRKHKKKKGFLFIIATFIILFIIFLIIFQYTSGQKKQKVLSSRTRKQLYYSVSCSNCQRSGCRRSYFYNGYSAQTWSNYYNVCKGCQCLDFKSKSFYR